MMRTKGLRWGLMALAVVAAVVGWSSAVGRESPPRGLLRMHDDFVLAFIDSQGFGQRRLPAMSGVMHRPVDGSRWFVAHLELIGVAKHDPPRVFSNEMSIFHQRNEKTPPPSRTTDRAITAWEKQALRDLDAGQRLIVEKQGKGLRVVGAIRAGDECLGCHKNKRAGDMLGAFVYSLWPMPAETPAK
ncbi:MAG: hypothetical protein HOP03_03305 [Lysobacter sp.]|nr:hypothetical protein [Lysobacter sp.]